MTKDEIERRLARAAGTPRELAESVGLDPQDSTFKRTLRSLVADGVLISEGETSQRRYRPAGVSTIVDSEAVVPTGTSPDPSPSPAAVQQPAPTIVDRPEVEAREDVDVQPFADPFSSLDAALLALVPCTAREFSDGGHRLGLKGRELGERKQRLGIVTFRAEDGWRCRV
jgi:hypothetical protein